MDNYLALDIGGTFIKYGLVNGEAEILKSGKVKTSKTLDELLSQIENLAQVFPHVSGIAISAPGAVANDGVIHGSSALPYLHGPNIKELIAERTSKTVFIENDANCAALAEVWKGAARGKKDILTIVIGTGIGGAIIKNGALHKGAHLHGGEFGYMLLDSHSLSSGSVWSRVASTAALVRKVSEKKQIDSETLSGEQIFRMADAGDQICIDALDQFYHLLAVGIYNLQYIYDPEIILIGGGISAREDLIVNINQKLDRILSKVEIAKIKPHIATCQFRQNANLLGAVYGFISSSPF